MPRIFISHAAWDLDLADKVCGDLRSAGYEAWFAGQAIRAGSSIVANVDSAILDCHHFIVILSQKAIESQWVEACQRGGTTQSNGGPRQPSAGKSRVLLPRWPGPAPALTG